MKILDQSKHWIVYVNWVFVSFLPNDKCEWKLSELVLCERVRETMLNAEMAETTPTPDNLFQNITEEVTRVAAGDSDPSNPNQFSDGITEYFSNTFGGFSFTVLTNKCGEWQDAQHMYFQVANALFLIAFLAPHKSYGFLLARFSLVFASMLMSLWSYLIECSLDTLIWNGLFMAVNFIYLFVLIYQMRPVRFEREIDAVITYRFTIIIYF